MKKFKDEAEIRSWYKDNSDDLFDCGQEFYQNVADEAIEYCLVDQQYYKVYIKAEIGFQWMNRGDKTSYVEYIESVEINEVDKGDMLAILERDYRSSLVAIQLTLTNKRDKYNEEVTNIQNYYVHD